MEPIFQIEQLLAKKKELFGQYEALTAQMLACPIETLETITVQRQKLCDGIDKVDREMAQQAEGMPDGPVVLAAIHLRCLRDQVPEGYLSFFDKAQEIFAIANRVRRMEPEITARVQGALLNLTCKIKENNRSVIAQAAKFGSGIAEGQGADRLGSKYQKV